MTCNRIPFCANIEAENGQKFTLPKTPNIRGVCVCTVLLLYTCPCGDEIMECNNKESGEQNAPWLFVICTSRMAPLHRFSAAFTEYRTECRANDTLLRRCSFRRPRWAMHACAAAAAAGALSNGAGNQRQIEWQPSRNRW